jgi:peroxiredoxin
MTSALQQQLNSISDHLNETHLTKKLNEKEVATYWSHFTMEDDSPYPPVQMGQTAPDFTLKDHQGSSIRLSEIVQSGRHVVLVWYRGAWCPFCSATLKAHNEFVAQYTALNAVLFAVTPTVSEFTAKTVIDYGLRFPVLSDPGNSTAKAYGTLNQLNEDLTKVHIKAGVDFEKLYGNSTHQLPHPGTFVVQANTGKLVLAHVDRDYRKRVEPSQVVATLTALKTL